jgi:hypothetical protein
MACGHRAPSGGGGGSAASSPLPVYTADANSGLCIGRSCTDALGAWGPSAPNKLRRVYTGALLATTIIVDNGGLKVAYNDGILCP